MNCHQPHNAVNMVWRPTALETEAKLAGGYKLLRLMPSASIQGTATIGATATFAGHYEDYDVGMQTHKAYTEYNPAAGKVYVNAANTIKVPETTMTALNTGPGKTIYTAYTGVEAAHQYGPKRDPQTVNQYALSPWCADCHNLNIGYWKNTSNAELGFKSHSDRTHPAPYTGAYNGPAQCYSCHRNDLPIVPATVHYGDPSGFLKGCERCHFGTGSYKVAKDNVDGAGTKSDFPHSGQGNTIKLLGPWQTKADPTKTSNIWMDTTGTAASVTSNNLDGVCLRCHVGIGTNH
jgi:hypothetical protein